MRPSPKFLSLLLLPALSLPIHSSTHPPIHSSTHPPARLPQQLTQQQDDNVPSAQPDDLYYTYFDEPIQLAIKPDVFAVKGQPVSTRGGARSFASDLKAHLFSDDLPSRGGSRSPQAPQQDRVRVDELGLNYALVSAATATALTAVQAQIQAFPATDEILPVLVREATGEEVILPNEMLVAFDPDFSREDIDALLAEQGFAIVRSLAFTENHYLAQSIDDTVQANLVEGNYEQAASQLLAAVNRLDQVEGVSAATPNFIPGRVERRSPLQPLTPDQSTDEFGEVNQFSANASARRARSLLSDPFASNLRLLQWHLHSAPLITCFEQARLSIDCLSEIAAAPDMAPGPDLQAVAAWRQGYSGQGVVVAVLDNLFQTNHPDLRNSFYAVDQPDECPGEQFGWDFSGVGVGDDFCRNGDANPAINGTELSDLRQGWRDIFTLDDGDLIHEYASEAAQITEALNCQDQCSEADVAIGVRYQLLGNTVGEFHGTQVSGVIAARPSEGRGLVGVAPNAKILPVRISPLGGGPSSASTFEAIGYVISRGADIVNMSFSMPNEIVANRIQTAISNNPRLIFVAAAGNSGGPDDAYPDRVNFPAAINDVVAVGATNLGGERAPYSNYGIGLDVVAPGGDLSFPNVNPDVGGVLTTGGTFLSDFWEGVKTPQAGWYSTFLDPQGGWVWTNGTSFSSPAVVGVLALMMSVDRDEQLMRDDLVEILRTTASYDRLQISESDLRRYEQLKDQGELPDDLTTEQYFFGDGLVDAKAAVEAVQRRLE